MKSKPRVRAIVRPLWQIFVASVLVSLPLTHASRPQDYPRLDLYLRCPDYVVASNQPIRFEGEILGSKKLLAQFQFSYRWEVSGGKITKGQGTPKIAVELSEPPSSGVGVINAKVIVGGGPPEFGRSESCTLKVDPKCARPELFEQYEGISLKDEQPSLDRLARYLKGEGSASFAFIVVYAGQESCLWEAEWRANRAKQYLVDTYKIEANRVITVDGGFRAKLNVDIFTAERDSCGPFPTPTVMVSSMHLTGLSCEDKYNETVKP